MKKLTEQQKVRRQILFNMPYLLLTFLIKERVLKCTFTWYYTEEGYNFWKGLNDKYKSIWEMNDSGALLLLSNC